MIDLYLLREELIFDEGKKLRPYTDTAGKITIGIGRNLTDNGMTDEEVFYLYKHDVEEVITSLDRNIPWWNFLDDVRKRVLANMCFNLGIIRLMGFHNALEAMQIGKWDEAADQMLQSSWAGQVGPRAVRLANMMRTGKKI